MFRQWLWSEMEWRRCAPKDGVVAGQAVGVEEAPQPPAAAARRRWARRLLSRRKEHVNGSFETHTLLNKSCMQILLADQGVEWL